MLTAKDACLARPIHAQDAEAVKGVRCVLDCWLHDATVCLSFCKHGPAPDSILVVPKVPLLQCSWIVKLSCMP